MQIAREVCSIDSKFFSAYATLNFDLGNEWSLRPGIRFENTDINATFQNNAPYTRKFSNWVPNLLVVKKIRRAS
ncbi:TonB-dependent receptor domain-containing protein [Chryseobacterium sp. P1-3]|uniref:TonB-dependent receptor domain-containing protein n=1 Tax=Chryseobacterium sp. (strain P1-3) TaxID=1517683 RepID=UPI002934D5A6|nr:TonB-dependent receptor [Chryseobacterium sp. P1-3]